MSCAQVSLTMLATIWAQVLKLDATVSACIWEEKNRPVGHGCVLSFVI